MQTIREISLNLILDAVDLAKTNESVLLLLAAFSQLILQVESKRDCLEIEKAIIELINKKIDISVKGLTKH